MVVLLNISAVQSFVGRELGEALSKELNTKLEFGKVELGALNRVILNNVTIWDQSGQKMLVAPRLSVKINPLALLNSRISISSAQIFGANISLYRQNAESRANYEFILDALSSDSKKPSKLDVKVGSLIIRRGCVSYRQLDVPKTEGFNSKDISVRGISSHIILNCLTNDSLNLNIKRISFTEQSGLVVRRLACRIVANNKHMDASDILLELANSHLDIDDIVADYVLKNGAPDWSSVKVDIPELKTTVKVSDLAFLVPFLKDKDYTLSLNSKLSCINRKLNVEKLNLLDKNSLSLNASGNYDFSARQWSYDISRLFIDNSKIADICEVINADEQMHKVLQRLGNIEIKSSGSGNANIASCVCEATTDCGNVSLNVAKNFSDVSVLSNIDNVSLLKLLEDDKFGSLSAHIDMNVNLVDNKIASCRANTEVSKLDYKGYHYSDIKLQGELLPNSGVHGELTLSDVNADLTASADYNYANKQKTLSFKTIVNNLNLNALGLIESEKDYDYAFQANGRFAGSDTRDFDGELYLRSGFMNIKSKGHYNLHQLKNNDFDLYATITNTDWIQPFVNIPLQLNDPAHIIARIDKDQNVDVKLDAFDFALNGYWFKDTYVNIVNPHDTLNLTVGSHIKNGQYDINFYSNADAHVEKSAAGQVIASVNLNRSTVGINNNKWHITPAEISYSPAGVNIHNFAVTDEFNRTIAVDGVVGRSATDSLLIQLKEIDVSEILDLVNFDDVRFDGIANGSVLMHSLLSHPTMTANLNVGDFYFEKGYMGTLNANANFDLGDGQIDIDAMIDDGAHHSKVIGFVSPKHKNLDLKIYPDGISLDFLNTYTTDFARDIDLRAWGFVEVVGTFAKVDLLGKADVSGSFLITPTNVKYNIENQPVNILSGDIQLLGATIKDRLGNIGVVDSHIRHSFLKKWKFDVGVDAHRLLAMQLEDKGNDEFFGTVFADGKCNISNHTGDVVIDVDVTPTAGTVFTYNASTPGSVGNQEFIRFNDRGQVKVSGLSENIAHTPVTYERGNLYMNFLIHATPSATLNVLMDRNSGEMITLNGNGSLRASFYNKGSFDLFGNYVVESGTYTMTLQNIIQRKFQFLSGGTIAFGGDAFNAPLNLQAQYSLPSVSLSDVGIGRSFANNNIRVDCIMNITGTPGSPRVDFAINMPTINADAKKMVMSLMNSEEEVNQQALYLLALGRFMNQGTQNGADDLSERKVSQSSLAMQSVLSGTVSQQLSNVIGKLLKSDKWNLGANISTGDEGWNNAEYEGIVSGRMFNNRLLFNGQFGYRDNPKNASSSFIGDFDIRYLLRPDGNIAIRAYNQTNDRYFTRNSLNTQGVGLILKHDF